MSRRTFALMALLVITGTTYAQGELSYFSERVKDFGTVPRGPMLVHYFQLTNPTQQTIQIGGARVSCGCVSASVAKTTLVPGESTVVIAYMDTRRFTGHKSVTIYVQLVHPTFQELTLQVRAFERDDFSIYPDTLNLPKVRKGSESTGSVRLSFYNGQPTKIVKVETESSFVSATAHPVTGQPGETAYELTAKTSKDLPVGKWFTDIWVTTSDPSLGRIRVPLVVQVDSSVTVTPSSLQVGEVVVGESAERKLIVHAEKPFKILDVRGDETSIRVKPIANESKATQVLNLVLQPSSAKKLDTKIRILTDLEENKEITVPLYGTYIVK